MTSGSEQAEIDAAWDCEIDRRVDEILTGKVMLVSGEETMAMARARTQGELSTFEETRALARKLAAETGAGTPTPER